MLGVTAYLTAIKTWLITQFSTLVYTCTPTHSTFINVQTHTCSVHTRTLHSCMYTHTLHIHDMHAYIF